MNFRKRNSNCIDHWSSTLLGRCNRIWNEQWRILDESEYISTKVILLLLHFQDRLHQRQSIEFPKFAYDQWNFEFCIFVRCGLCGPFKKLKWVLIFLSNLCILNAWIPWLRIDYRITKLKKKKKYSEQASIISLFLLV